MRIYQLALYFLLLMTSCIAFADYSYRDTRHFDGTRYLALSHIKVYSQPNKDSEIVSNIERWHMLYASPTSNANWLTVKGVGARIYPDSYQGSPDTLSVENGRFTFREHYIDRDDYIAKSGFIEASSVGNMDSPLLLPLDDSEVTKVINPWQETGVNDTRFVPSNASKAPFSSSVLITVKGYEDKPFCSGFFIESNRLIGTAGHCITAFQKYLGKFQLQVGVHAETGIKEWIPVTIKAYKDGDGHDWALLELGREPKLSVTPLNFLSNGEWLKSGSIEVLSLGFGWDLQYVKRHQFKVSQDIVHGSRCEIPLSLINISVDDILTTDASNFGCITTKGDSGGALIIWNTDNNRYELIGIRAFGSHEESLLDDDDIAGDHDYINRFDAKAKALWTQTKQRIDKYYDIHSSWDDRVTQGSAALANELKKSLGWYQSVQGSTLSQEFVNQVFQNLKKPNLAFNLSDLIDRNNVGVHSDNEIYQTAYYVSYILNELRKQAFNGPGVRDKWLTRYRQDADLGDKLDLDFLKKSNVPYQVWGIGDNYKLIPEQQIENHIKEIYSAIQQAQKHQKKQKKTSTGSINYTEVAIDVAQDTIKRLKNKDSFVVEVGGDIFVVKGKTGRVLEVVRNWMNYYDGNLAHTRQFPFYDPAVEQPATEAEAPLTSDVSPTDNLRSSDFGSPTPISIPGAKLINPKTAWREILPGLERREKDAISGNSLLSKACESIANLPGWPFMIRIQQRYCPKQPESTLVLAAIEDINGVPTAVDLSFAGQGGSYDDDIQQRLAKTMEGMQASKAHRIITYCHHDQCWLSYNLALRLVHLGYTNVSWMRTGIDGWIESGLPLGWVATLK